MTISKKIADVSKQVGSLLPDKRNESQNYTYISADKILERAGKALAEAGIAIYPSVISTTIDVAQFTNKYQKVSDRFDALVNMSMVVSDGEETITCLWVGAGSDFSVPDKAVYKAITSGHKYFLMKLMNIGVGNEDGEHETQPEPGTDTAEKKAPTKKAPAPKQTGNIFDTVTTKEGVPYSELDIPSLANTINGIEKYLKDNPDIEQGRRDEYELKRDAAKHFIELKKEQA